MLWFSYGSISLKCSTGGVVALGMFTQRTIQVLLVFVVILSSCGVDDGTETVVVGDFSDQAEVEAPLLFRDGDDEDISPIEDPVREDASVTVSEDAPVAPTETDSPIEDDALADVEGSAGSTETTDLTVPATASSPPDDDPDSSSSSAPNGGSDDNVAPLPVEAASPPTSLSHPTSADSPSPTITTARPPGTPLAPGTSAAPTTEPAPRTATPTTEAAPSTTAAPATTSAPTPTAAPTTAIPSTTAAPAASANFRQAPSMPTLSAGGWIVPEPGVNVGYPGAPNRSGLNDFVSANDGPHGVTIDAAFLAANADAPWLFTENGRHVIAGVDADGLCLNIKVTLTLRNSYVNCPTRIQSGAWGYAGDVDDAPAVNIVSATGVIIEGNTITCSGYDADICSRSVRVSAADATIRFNDLSFARGAVQLSNGTNFSYNYAHSFSFGFDPRRASNPSDNVTHNNAVNNQGYRDTLVEGNYIVATYGRVSQQPSTYRNPHFRALAYTDGIVEVGDPLNGFTFTNYLHNGSGSGTVTVRNYVLGAGRAFRCNGSSNHSTATCAAEISHNMFGDDNFDLFLQTPLFEDKDGNGSISGRCNGVVNGSGATTIFDSNEFGNAGTHGRSGC